MVRLNWKYFYYPQNPCFLWFLPQTGRCTCYGPQHTQIGALSLGFSQLCSQVFIILEPGSGLIQGHSLNGPGPIMALALIFLYIFGAFSLIPGGCLLPLQVVSMFMVSGSFVLALSAIPIFIKLRSCFLLPACFRSCLRIGHWHVAAKFLCSSSLPSFS